LKDLPSKIDKYEIVEEIGRGGMAIVYKGLHPFLEKYVAIKVLPEYFVQDKEFVDRFTREAKTMMLLQHLNIVRIYDAGIYENKYFIVMDYIDGKTLKDLIKKEGKIEIGRAVKIIEEVCEALSYAHKNGVIHRDVKPSNIIIEDKTGKSYITDFGIAKAVSGTKLTQTGVSLGTPEYMSPEQFSEKGSIDQRTDIYSLGIVFYEMLTGDIPFKGDTPLGVAFKHVNTPPPHPRIINPSISPYLEKIILKMLAKDVDDRYKSMDDLIKDLSYFKNKDYEKISALSYVEEKKSKLSITSDPPDAKVYIDGEYIGKTPITNKELSYGNHKILLVKSGYEDYGEEISLAPHKRTHQVNIVLKKEKISEEQLEEVRGRITSQEIETKKVEKVIAAPTSPEPLSSEELTRKVERKLPIQEQPPRKERLKSTFLRKSFLIPVIVALIAIPLIFSLTKLKKENLANNSNTSNLTSVTTSVTITSNPSQADVFIDENKIGITPVEGYQIKTGTHTILLKKEGYQDFTEVIEVKEGDKLSKSYPLVKISQPQTTITSVPVSITSNPTAAKVYIDNTYIGDTPINNYKLSTGTRTLKVTKDGYNDYTQTFTLASSDTSKAIPVVLTKKEEPKSTTPKTGTLSISSTPTGAKVYVNNQYKGITPLTLTLNEGNYSVKLSKENYEDSTQSVTVKANQTGQVSITLKEIPSPKPKTGNLSVSSIPAGAQVYVNGTYKGLTPITINNLNPGTYSIQLKLDGYKIVYGSVVVSADDTKYYSETLTLLTGTLSISSDPSGANVYINGDYKGTTPLNLTLAPGNYTVKLTKEGYEDHTESTTIQSGMQSKVQAQLKKKSMAGTLVWKYATSKCVYSSPEIYNGNVYMGSVDSYIYCLSAENGNLTWKYKTGHEVWSSPAIYNGKVYIGSDDTYIYCLNAVNGSLVWRYETESSVFSSPTISNGKVYVGSWDTYIYCLNADDGSLVWKYKTGGGVESSPTISNGNVYIGSVDSYIYCLSADNGILIWKYGTGKSIYSSSPTISNGKVYVGSLDAYIYCLNADDGSLVWKYKTGYEVWSSPTISNGNVYVGSWDTYIYCLNADDGSLVWKYKTGGYVTSPPTIYKGKVYVGSFDSYIYCLNAENGDFMWKYDTGAYVVRSSPLIYNGKLYVGSDDGYIYCLDIGEP